MKTLTGMFWFFLTLVLCGGCLMSKTNMQPGFALIISLSLAFLIGKAAAS